MLYKKNSEPFSKELFENPTSEYRATPFWAWNCALKRELLEEEIDHMADMGFGGFHMHPRVGLATPYLSDEFMDRVDDCIKKAESNKMLAWLYDEDKWPSGFGGGFVTCDRELREKSLFMTKKPGKGEILARYHVELNADGTLKRYEKTDGGEWYAVLYTAEDDDWHNKQAYVDTLSKKAIDRFIEVTHERYKERIGEKFGNTVPAIFTDEPQFRSKRPFGKAEGDYDAIMPFTTDLPDTYKSEYGEDLLEKLPEIFWELPDSRVSVTRYRFHDHVAERFARAFADNIGGWCDKNGIYLTGHMMQEPTLESQNGSVGDCMRSYRGFGFPGMDLLCDNRELTTAKQVQSSVHQYGREGSLSELYGVTGWNFDFRKHIKQGNWQAALGITVRVPHLYWMSMKGEAKRDYPASIGHQSPWYKEYKYVEDHFARLNVCLTRGRPEVRVGVIHPIESYWLRFGPEEQTASVRREMDERFTTLPDWLLYSLIDFDYINEANLPKQLNGLDVGEMRYDTVLVPWCDTLRSTTLTYLKQHRANGGKVIFAGGIPTMLDAVPSDEVEKFAKECEIVGWSRAEIVSALEADRDIDLSDNKGERSGDIIYQLRREGDTLILYGCQVLNHANFFRIGAKDYTLRIRGEYIPEYMDTFTGKTNVLYADYKDGCTLVPVSLDADDDFLFMLRPGRSDAEKTKTVKYKHIGYMPATVDVTLDEPNVLLLDSPEYRVNGGEWRERKEIISVSDSVKDELGLVNAVSRACQPWVLGEAIAENDRIELRYTFDSEIDYDGALLALEDSDRTAVSFNGETVDVEPIGFYVDSSIAEIRLGRIRRGENLLILSRPFGAASTLESVFILGDFGVDVNGMDLTVTGPVRKLPFGDQSHYGLPFYGGNVNYKARLSLKKGSRLHIPHSAQPVCIVSVNGERTATVAKAPFTADLRIENDGEYDIEIKAFGNRINTFGALHMQDPAERWFGPNGWRKTGAVFTPGYNLTPCGIIAPPMIEIPED